MNTIKKIKKWIPAPLKEFIKNKLNLGYYARENETIRDAVREINRRSVSFDNRVFVDCGFNTCRVMEKFVNRLDGFTYFGFEVQEQLRPYADRMKKKYPEAIQELRFAAVGSRDGAIEFFEPSTWGPNYKGATTTLRSANTARVVDLTAPKTIESVDLGGWLRSRFTDADYVVLKMDIEGAEYDVLDAMCTSGALRLVKLLLIEFHPDKLDDDKKYLDARVRGEIKKMTEVIEWQ